MPNHPHRRVLCSSRRAFITEHLSPSITESIKTISFASTSSSRSSRCIRAILRPINALWFGSTNDGLRFLLRFPYAFMNSAHKFRVSQSTLSCLSLPKVKQLPWIYSESTLNLLWIYTERIHSGSAEKSARSDSERIVALNCRSVCRLSSFDLSSRLAITPRSECEVIGPIFDLCLFYKRFDLPNLGVRLLCIARFCRKLYGSAS